MRPVDSRPWAPKEAFMSRVLFAALALAVLGGCSTMKSSYDGEDDMDLEYVAYVEHWAKRYGTQVVWINAPRKQTAAAR
jgi:hypothetical protein